MLPHSCVEGKDTGFTVVLACLPKWQATAEWRRDKGRRPKRTDTWTLFRGLLMETGLRVGLTQKESRLDQWTSLGMICKFLEGYANRKTRANQRSSLEMVHKFRNQSQSENFLESGMQMQKNSRVNPRRSPEVIYASVDRKQHHSNWRYQISMWTQYSNSHLPQLKENADIWKTDDLSYLSHYYDSRS